MQPQLPDAFLNAPLAHRGLHDRTQNRPENSRAAILAAFEAGYGCEIDVQISSDGEAMVFHDDQLERLTGRAGSTRTRSAAELSQMRILGSDERIHTLEEILAAVNGRGPLLIEIKDQDGAMGEDLLNLEERVAEVVKDYQGSVALMSFNPHSVAKLAQLAPNIPRGIVTAGYRGLAWNPISESRRAELRAVKDFDRVGASFISHQVDDLSRDRVGELKSQGVPILCWTVRSAEKEAIARKIADNITFESYLPAFPASGD